MSSRPKSSSWKPLTSHYSPLRGRPRNRQGPEGCLLPAGRLLQPHLRRRRIRIRHSQRSYQDTPLRLHQRTVDAPPLRLPHRQGEMERQGRVSVPDYAARHGNDDLGIVNNLTSIISKDEKLLLRSINIDSHDGLFRGNLVVMMGDTARLEALIKKLRTAKGVKQVERI